MIRENLTSALDVILCEIEDRKKELSDLKKTARKLQSILNTMESAELAVVEGAVTREGNAFSPTA